MSNTTIPNKLILTCTITGKQVTWTNKNIIAAKIAEFGSLEAFVAQFKCRGAGKPVRSVAADVTKASVMKEVFEDGVALGKMTKGEYAKSQFGQAKEVPTGDVRYVTRVHTFDGRDVTVNAPYKSGDEALIANGQASFSQ